MRACLFPALGLTIALALAGCGHAVDARLRNPLNAKLVEPNQIVKTHNFTARDHSIPPSALTDRASLLSLDAQQVCFGLTLHELAAIDIGQVEPRLQIPGFADILQAQVTPGPATVQAFPGRNPERRQTGVDTYCAYEEYGRCRRWETRPVYSIVYVPAQVNVYQTCGQVCFQHGGAITPITPDVTLILRLPVLTYDPAYRTSGFFGGSGTKSVKFRWGFSDAPR